MAASLTVVSTYRPSQPVPTESLSIREYTNTSPRLQFFHRYMSVIDSHQPVQPLASFNNTTFYLPHCKFYNADGKVYEGADSIWPWVVSLFGPFQSLRHDIISLVEIEEALPSKDGKGVETRWNIHMDCTRFMKMASWDGERAVPLFAIFTIEKREARAAEEEEYGIGEAKMWWDRSIIFGKP